MSSENVTGAGNQQGRFNCEACGKEIKNRDKSKQKRNKHHFCSKECYRAWWPKNVMTGKKHHLWLGGPKPIACKQCGTEFLAAPQGKRPRKFCSQSCAATHRMTGSGNPLWKGGVTEENDKARKTPEYKEWRTAVYERDRWTCQLCEYKGDDIIAHHIKKFSEYKELRYDVDNGITLCRSCHIAIENPQRLHAKHSTE